VNHNPLISFNYFSGRLLAQKYQATTDSDHTFNIAGNLLDQDFSAEEPNRKWALSECKHSPAS
jgi:hypothetical protein